MKYYIGIDIGGTKIATLLADENMNILDRRTFFTKGTKLPEATIEKMFKMIEEQMSDNEITIENIKNFGISCGGPLNSSKGVIMSPPNLPGWDNVEMKKIFEKKYNKLTYLQNDANACAIAEWKIGAGKGYKNVIFLTFGTGMGAGLILNGRLYAGIDDMAGEVGHMRLEDEGPTGYGKVGSFEGFCSGGGIAKLGKYMIEKEIEDGYKGKLIIDLSEGLTTQKIADRAKDGEYLAIKIIEKSAEKLGKGLSILVDLLNPEAIIIGSIFTRCEDLFRGTIEKVLKKEALGIPYKRCKILKSELGESIGDYGALFTATNDY
ncbi:ROK family protein [Psychrilyobacter sp.]|uniref:ROK family protein n=1 Tax=Psychrilyobacter sp. TaxID=2586924 RepID=UPI003016A526